MTSEEEVELSDNDVPPESFVQYCKTGKVSTEDAKELVAYCERRVQRWADAEDKETKRIDKV